MVLCRWLQDDTAALIGNGESHSDVFVDKDDADDDEVDSSEKARLLPAPLTTVSGPAEPSSDTSVAPPTRPLTSTPRAAAVRDSRAYSPKLHECTSRAATWSLQSPKVPFLNTWSLMSLNLKKWSLKSLFLCNWLFFINLS